MYQNQKLEFIFTKKNTLSLLLLIDYKRTKPFFRMQLFIGILESHWRGMNSRKLPNAHWGLDNTFGWDSSKI